MAPAPVKEKFSTIESVLSEGLPEDDYSTVIKTLYGKILRILELPAEAREIAENQKFELRGYEIRAAPEQLRCPRKIRIAAIQNAIVRPTDVSVEDQRDAIHWRVGEMIKTAASCGANIVCMQEAWPMPFGFCTRGRLPWTEFAESAEHGPTTEFLKKLARRFGIVIVSPILERDVDRSDLIWDTAVVISHTGSVIGKSRKNHISQAGDFTKFSAESALDHPVFQTVFGRIAIDVGDGHHQPLSSMVYALNGAEVIFNPSAAVCGISETLWRCEAVNAAVSNHVYVFAINRVGTEAFPSKCPHFTNGENGPSKEREFAHFFGSSYVAAPDASSTPGLSRSGDGILIAEIDLNLSRQIKDSLGFRKTQRLEEYANLLSLAARPDFKPHIVAEA